MAFVRCGFPMRRLAANRAPPRTHPPPSWPPHAPFVRVGFLPWVRVPTAASPEQEAAAEPTSRKAARHVTIQLSSDQEARAVAREQRSRHARVHGHHAEVGKGGRNQDRDRRRSSRRHRSRSGSAGGSKGSADRRGGKSGSRSHNRKELTITILKRYSLLKLKELCAQYDVTYEKKDTTCPLLLEKMKQAGDNYM